jgi:RND family efflux transporter MFP subunit
VLDPSRIEFVISVPESLISLTKYVEEITVTFDALPGIDIPARIKEVSKEASQATRTYPVTLLMGQPANAEILPGMAGEARIVSRLPEQSKHVGIEIPATAVFSGEDLEQSYVWIVDETSETLSRREVKIVGLSRAGTRVKAGLNPGEWIVIKGVHSVSEGEVVQILDASEEKPRS